MKVKIILLFTLLLMVYTVLIAQTPEWLWVAQAGGTGWDESTGITLDDLGNSYVTGHFAYNATFGSHSLNSTGMIEIFVAKLNSSGNWQWAIQASGTDTVMGNDIEVDNNGNIYVTGYFNGSTSFGTHTLSNSGNNDIFVAKADANGNWQWAIQAGASGPDVGLGISTDDIGNCYVTGFFRNTVNFGSYSLTSSGLGDVFVAKIDMDGNWLWVSQAGGNSGDLGRDITLNDEGNCIVIGDFNETATFGPHSLTGESDIFVAKMDTNGNWIWATQASGLESDDGNGITVDELGNCYVTGIFMDTINFGPHVLTSNGSDDIFLAKIDSNGNWLWANQAGGSWLDHGFSVSIDDIGNCYATGYFSETADFGSQTLLSSGYSDVFVAKVDTNGNWIWAYDAGGISSDRGSSIITDDTGNSYIAGGFGETANFGSFSINSNGGGDIFVAKLNSFVSADDEITPMEIFLSNYPNPFNPTTTIEFSIHNDSKVELTILNIKGQKIKTLAHNEFTKGDHSIFWNGDDEKGEAVSSGVYLFKLKVNGKNEAVKKCLLLK